MRSTLMNNIERENQIVDALDSLDEAFVYPSCISWLGLPYQGITD